MAAAVVCQSAPPLVEETLASPLLPATARIDVRYEDFAPMAVDALDRIPEISSDEAGCRLVIRDDELDEQLRTLGRKSVRVSTARLRCIDADGAECGPEMYCMVEPDHELVGVPLLHLFVLSPDGDWMVELTNDLSFGLLLVQPEIQHKLQLILAAAADAMQACR